MLPLALSSSTRARGAVHGSTTEKTSSSRILRAMSCVYCDPKSRMTMVDDPCVSTTSVYRGAHVERQWLRRLHGAIAPVGRLRHDRSVETQQLAFPPVAGCALLVYRREPVLPEHGADELRRGLREGVAAEEREHIGVVVEQ